jgi:hypothetical protein
VGGGLTGAQVSANTHGEASDAWWEHARDRALLDAADALHEESRVGDALWTRLSGILSEPELLDLLMLCGWYHAISFTANGVALQLEDGVPRFADYRDAPRD